jgi:dihydropteroate synthase
MGILNLSADSFSDGYPDFNDAIKQAEILINDGADIIDIGAQSTRPGLRVLTPKSRLKSLPPL